MIVDIKFRFYLWSIEPPLKRYKVPKYYDPNSLKIHLLENSPIFAPKKGSIFVLNQRQKIFLLQNR